MTNHPNRSKQQQPTHTPQAEWLAGVLAKLPADDHARVLALILAQNRINAELLAALKAIYSEFKAYRPDCFEAAEKAELNSPDMIIAEDGNLHAMRGSTVVIVLGARRAIAKAESH